MRKNFEVGELVVIVEESPGVPIWVGAARDPDAAAKLAYETARAHRPVRPTVPKERTLFRAPDGSWLVRVKGAMSEHCFTVTVLDVEGGYPDSPE